LKARVSELEKLQQQQQQLLTLKDSALAAAQQTLAKSNAAVATPTPAPAASKPSTQAVTPAPVVASTQAATPAAPQSQGSGFWLWGGLGLLVAATIGWLLTRKRHAAATAVPKRIFDTEALAASIPVAPPDADAAEEGVGLNAEFMPDQLIAPRPMQAPRTARVAVTEAVAPPWHDDGHVEASAPAAAATATLASPNAQLTLAQACLDRGDDDAARVLLLEVMDGRDPAARDVAARLLRDL